LSFGIQSYVLSQFLMYIVVELWDLDTAQKLRVIRAHDRNIESLQMGWGYLWVASSDGWVSVSDKGSLCWL